MSPIFQIINYSEDAGYVTITRKYVKTSGSVIKTEYDTIIIGSSYTIPTGMAIDGYAFKEQDRTGTITATGNITITYTYLTYYGIIVQCQTTSGTDIEATMTYELEGSTYTVAAAPTLTNYEYQSSSPAVGSTFTVTGVTTIYHYYEQTILWLYDTDQGGDINANTGGWSTSIVYHSDTSNYDKAGSGSAGSSYLYTKLSGTSYAYSSIATKNAIDVTNYSTLKFYISYLDAYSASNKAEIGGLAPKTYPVGNYDSKRNAYIQSTGWYTIDISSLSGEYYFYLFNVVGQTKDTCELRCTKVYLE